MEIELSEIDYVQKCLEQYRKNKAVAEQKLKQQESWHTRNQFLNELRDEAKKIMDDDGPGYGGRQMSLTLYDSVKGVIRASIGLRSFINLRSEDVPEARAIAKKVFDIVREERR